MADPYNFNAPQYFDFIQEATSADATLTSNQENGEDLTSDAANAMDGNHHHQQDEQEGKSKDPWDFDAPTWTDLSAAGGAGGRGAATSTTTTTTTTGTSTSAAASPSSRISSPQTPPPQQQQQQQQPKAPANLVSSMRRPTPPSSAAPSAVRKPLTSRIPTPGGAPSTRRSPSERKAMTSSTTTITSTVRTNAVAAAAVKKPSTTAAAGSTRVGGGAASNTKPKVTTRTFTNRPRKAADTAPSATGQHSFLSHTAAASVRKRTAVDNLASFLRPTAASWGRNQQKEGSNAGSLSSTRPPMRTTTSASSSATRSGPVRAVGKIGGGGTSAGTTSSSRTAIATSSHLLNKTGHQRGGEVETTEEQQLRLAAEAQARIKKQTKENQAAVERNRVIGSTNTGPLRSTKALTIPRSPRLHMNERHGEKTGPAGRDLEVEIFSKTKPASPRGPKPLTVPKAPSFQTDARAQHRAPLKATEVENVPPPPPSSSRRAAPPAAPISTNSHHHQQHLPQKPPSPRITVPHSPHLSTNVRAQVREGMHPHKPSFAAKEERDAEEMKHQFKARPLDRRILQSTGEMGVPKVTKNGVTHPEPFHFATDSRVRRPNSADQEREAFEHMAMHYEDAYHHQAHHQHQQGHYKPQLVVPEPFRLETEKRGELHKIMFENKVQQEKEAELMAREVHANPPPRFNGHGFVPHASDKELTEINAFPLESVRRHEECQQVWQDNVRRMREEELQQAHVKARPLPASTYQKAFEVKPSDREPLIPVSMNLNSSIRAEERKAYEAEVKAKAEEHKAAEEAAAAETKRLQEQELRRIRNLPVEQGGLRFVAKAPLVVHQPMVPGPSARKLTVPVSPNLQTKSRAYVHRPQSNLRPSAAAAGHYHPQPPPHEK